MARFKTEIRNRDQQINKEVDSRQSRHDHACRPLRRHIDKDRHTLPHIDKHTCKHRHMHVHFKNDLYIKNLFKIKKR